VTVRSVLIVVLALVFGGSAAVGITSLRPQPSSGGEVEQVVVVSVDVPRGTTLTDDVVKVRDWPKNGVPPGALTRLEDAVGRVSLDRLVQGEPVQDARLAPKGAGRGMAALIPPGMQAVTIQTPNVSVGVAGFVLPRSKVDVVLTVSTNYGMGEKEYGGGTATTLLQNVEILAVDGRIEIPVENRVDPKDLRSVTLLVTPYQATLLALGQSKGTLQLSLRNPSDTVASNPRAVTLRELRLHQEQPWDVKAKKVLEGFGTKFAEALAKQPPPAPKAVTRTRPAAPKTERRTVPFRTFRGGNETRQQVPVADIDAR
jgi:pilus assembly protein CpaB